MLHNNTIYKNNNAFDTNLAMSSYLQVCIMSVTSTEHSIHTLQIQSGDRVNKNYIVLLRNTLYINIQIIYYIGELIPRSYLPTGPARALSQND